MPSCAALISSRGLGQSAAVCRWGGQVGGNRRRSHRRVSRHLHGENCTDWEPLFNATIQGTTSVKNILCPGPQPGSCSENAHAVLTIACTGADSTQCAKKCGNYLSADGYLSVKQIARLHVPIRQGYAWALLEPWNLRLQWRRATIMLLRRGLDWARVRITCASCSSCPTPPVRPASPSSKRDMVKIRNVILAFCTALLGILAIFLAWIFVRSRGTSDADDELSVGLLREDENLQP